MNSLGHANLPSKVWFVAVLPGGKPLASRQRGGGHFTQKKAAVDRYTSLIGSGVYAALYEADVEFDWELLYMYKEGENA